MGTPFQPKVKSYLQLTVLRIHPETNKLTRKEHNVPDTIIIEPTKKKVRRTNARIVGMRTKLPRLHYIGALLLHNEILACQQQAVDREGLLRNFRKEFPEMSSRVSRRYFDSFANYVFKYNTGRLYAQQPLPPLFAFYWNKNGYIRHNRYYTQVVGFQFCKRHLIKAKFADPRFFKLEERREYEKDPEWHVPSDAEISKIEAKIKKPLYDSIEFPPGYGKNYNPV